MFDPLSQRESAWFVPGTADSVPRQMAFESKPLFHPEVIRQQVRALNLLTCFAVFAWELAPKA
jgi:hypothetical protein